MDIIKAIEERRSVRNYKNEVVDRKLMEEIVEASRWSPSWANFQVVRYTLVDDAETIKRLATAGVNGFVYNKKTLENAKGVAVLSFIKGKSGKLVETEYATNLGNTWEMFDAGIACQTFCLVAHAKGVGTCIFGVIDDKAIAEIVGLPEGESVATLIVYGYEEGEHAAATPRHETKDILRFV